MPVNDPTPPVVRDRRPRHDAPDWRDIEHIAPRPHWLGRKPGGDAAPAVPPIGPRPTPLAGGAEAED